MTTAKKLAGQLKNVGPALATRMLKCGIDTPEKLRRLGAIKAFDLMYKDGDRYGDFNAAYLYALEGAIRDCDWSEIPPTLKADFQAHARKRQKSRNRG